MTSARRATEATLRVIACAVLYAVLAHALAIGLGIWAAGSLSLGTTLLLALVCPIWMFICLPTWLGWRVLHPLGRGRLSFLVRWCCWLSPLARARELRGIAVFIDVDAGRSLPLVADLPADAWTALAAAREAERLGDAARAERIVDALAELPPGGLFPWLARRHGVERLVTAALRRGDAERAIRHARLGAGPLSALLASLNRDDAVLRPLQGVRRGRVWLLWIVAPCRALTWPLVRARAGGSGLSSVTLPLAPMLIARGHEVPAGRPVALRHLDLIAAAAEGRPVSAGAVFTLAAEWESRLDEAACARLHARALALGARQGGERARALREGVIAELAALGACAEGVPAAAGAGEGTVARELRARIRAHLLEAVEAALAPLADGRRAPPGNILAAWERWLAVRAAIDRAEAFAGTEAVIALWYGGVRDAVWAWGCALFGDRRARSGWAAHMMFSWIAERAEVYGDFPATLLNRENARSALAHA
jgi:hypothetical protein